jgi:ribokinase
MVGKAFRAAAGRKALVACPNPGRVLAVMGTVAMDTLALVERLPARNETARVTEVRDDFGGCAGNVAAGLATLGLRPRLVSSVGRDFPRTEYGQRLKRIGADLAGLHYSDLPTARAFLFTDKAGAQQIYYSPGASVEMGRCEPFKAGIAHFAAGEISAYPAFMARCERVGFDPGQEVFHRDPEEIRRCLPHTDYLFVNEHELRQLQKGLGMGIEDFLRVGPEVVVESRGPKGQVLHMRDQRVTCPAAKARLVEPSGAGDAHRAGFLYGLARGYRLEVCARLGSVMAAFVLEAVGAQGNLPSEAKLRERYKREFGSLP